CRARRPDAIHASRRNRGRVGVDRSDRRSLDGRTTTPAAVCSGQLGPGRRDRSHGAGWPPLARSAADVEAIAMGWAILWWVLVLWAAALAVFTLVLWRQHKRRMGP